MLVFDFFVLCSVQCYEIPRNVSNEGDDCEYAEEEKAQKEVEEEDKPTAADISEIEA